MEEHGSGGGGDDLGETGDVKHSIGRDGGRVVVVGEAANCITENDIPGREDGEGASGKGANSTDTSSACPLAPCFLVPRPLP